MMDIKNKIFLIFPVFILVVMLIAAPERAYSGTNGSSLGCCLVTPTECTGCDGFDCALTSPLCAAAGGDADEAGSICVDSSCTAPIGLGCCVVAEDDCVEDVGFEACDAEIEGEAWFRGASCQQLPQCGVEEREVPALSEYGLIALMIILGVIGFFIIKRRQVIS